MPTRNIELTPELEQFIAGRVAEGFYEDASDVVRAALRKLESEDREYQEKLTALRAAIDEGDASGIAEGSVDEIFAQIHQELGISESKQ